MGMAASQARYLGLTARKTNVEYEGQQINQARTALANQSANLWNQMLNMKVPTAPNKTDYVNEQYSFSDGYNEYEIDALQSTNAEINGEKYNYVVTYHYTQDAYKAIQEKNTNPQVQKIPTISSTTGKENVKVEDDAGNYKVTSTTGAKIYKPCTAEDVEILKALAREGKIKVDDITQIQNEFYQTEGSNSKVKIYCRKEDLEEIKNKALQMGDLSYAEAIADDYKYKLGNKEAERYDKNDSTQKTALDQIRHDYPELVNVPDSQIWKYEFNGKTYYVSENELNECVNSGTSNYLNNMYQISSNIDYQKGLNQYYATNLQQNVTETKYARLDDASGTGRFQNIKLQDSSAVFALNSEEKSNELAYENSMQQYEYDVLQYEKTIADINAKTSKIQVQDRTLELRLRQLDTEQKALATEMDAVKQVIQKNIESTFKTFQ
ncbi:hypothetical protein IJG72_05665 [bacterium]|nr:hypothetical protein [bacterium]